LKEKIPSPVLVSIRIEQETGKYAGAALSGPIKMHCGTGKFRIGDWSLSHGLYSYSGGAWYRKKINLTAGQISGSTVLDLGKVISSAEVIINNRKAGIKLSPPFRFNISGFVKEGENIIEILVYNTAANHYSTIPTRYRGSLESGLIGPVEIRYKN
jgi:hypothetical protein